MCSRENADPTMVCVLFVCVPRMFSAKPGDWISEGYKRIDVIELFEVKILTLYAR